MNTCKNCKYYTAKVKEEMINRAEWMKSNRTIPAVMRETFTYSFGVCSKVVLPAHNMSWDEMQTQSCKIMTWDGSSYMSGADVSEDFGCIAYESK